MAVERQQHTDIQSGGLLQHRLDLCAVLAHNVGIIPPCLVQHLPVEVHLIGEQGTVQRAEAAEGIGGQQQFVRLVIGHQHLRPVDHGRGDKAQGMAAGAEGVTLLHHGDAAGQLRVEELGDHVLGGGTAQDAHVRVLAGQVGHLGGVVRLHVVDHQIVRGFAVQDVGHIFTEGGTHGAVHRVEQDSLVVHQEIAVEADAVGHAEHALEQGQTAAIRAHPGVVVVDFSDAIHGHSSFP